MAREDWQYIQEYVKSHKATVGGGTADREFAMISLLAELCEQIYLLRSEMRMYTGSINQEEKESKQ